MLNIHSHKSQMEKWMRGQNLNSDNLRPQTKWLTDQVEIIQ